MRLLLDTCAFLWFTTDDSELSDEAKNLFRNTENFVYLSSVSVWEIVVKYHLGKLPLPDEPEYFIEQQCALHLIETLPLEAKAIYHLSRLPNYHRDPFDRMLICQAIEHGLVIVTSDNLITQYPVSTVW
ncbi:MAG: type II toxin-antitoxin system VapC family toxin [Desulfobacterales bacterium]|nr:type II toxin-antitoxin system VapC family toxin [Desulfobacterales bacterium]